MKYLGLMLHGIQNFIKKTLKPCHHSPPQPLPCIRNVRSLFLFWKIGDLILNWLPLSLLQAYLHERLFSQSDKYEIKETSETPISQVFSELGKSGSKLFFPLNWVKLRNLARLTLKKPKLSLGIVEKLKVQPKTF